MPATSSSLSCFILIHIHLHVYLHQCEVRRHKRLYYPGAMVNESGNILCKCVSCFYEIFFYNILLECRIPKKLVRLNKNAFK
jgi:hypothetical protein